AARVIVFIKKTPVEQPYSQRAEIMPRNRPVLHSWNTLNVSGKRTVQRHEKLCPVLSLQRQAGSSARCLNSGDLFDPLEQLVVESCHLGRRANAPRIRLRIISLRQVHRKSENAAGVKSRVHVQNALEASDSQS